MASEDQKIRTQKNWEKYLDSHKEQAYRQALQEAKLLDPETDHDVALRRGSVNGTGAIQIIFTPPIKPPDEIEEETKAEAE